MTGPLARAGILAGAAAATLFVSRPAGILDPSRPPAAIVEEVEPEPPPIDPVQIRRIAEEMHLAEKSLRLPAGYVFWKEVVAKVTAYEPSELSCPGTADGKTSLGDNAWRMDGVAADPKAIPYRTLVWIPGVAELKEVDDTGSAMRKAWRERAWREKGAYHIDLRMTTPKEAYAWGVKMLPIRLYRKVSDLQGEASSR